MNCLTKMPVWLPMIVLLPLSGCASRPDLTLNPPTDTEWVTVAVKLPPETEVLPMDVLYRSDKCQREVYDQTVASHRSMDRGLNSQTMMLEPQVGNDIRQTRIALDGGGKCEWKLSAVRIGIQLSKSSFLANGKDVTAANYVFDFDDEGYRSSFGKGEPKIVSGDLFFQTEFFPMIYVSHLFNEIDIDLFAGDQQYEKWNRYYRVNGSKSIRIEPILYLNKVVKLESPKSPPGKVTVTYPDGSSDQVSDIVPDYNKLLSMK